MLFADYQILSAVFNSLYTLALQEEDMEKAHYYVGKQEALARLFEMGEYYELMGRLEIAAVEKDEAAVADTAEKMLSSIQGIRNFTESPLYGHVAFKNTESDLFTGDKMKQNLIKMFKEDEAFRFMNDNARWQEILEEN